jgi:glycine/D-amino acid oxidase-like deaminating enzyme
MANKAAWGRTQANPIELDVLIIGGGVQGLWLLNDLVKAGYSVLLLEKRELGGEQTCHSHVYIHQGHLYDEQRREEDLIRRLGDVNALWNNWFAENPPRRGVTPSYFGYQSEADAQQKRNFWSSLGLASERVDVPPSLVGGAIRVVDRSPENCLDGNWLVESLTRGLKHLISRISSVERISVRGHQLTEVEVVMPRGERLVFRPRAMVLTAGAGNQALLQCAARQCRPLVERVAGAQQIRKSFMLVVKGKRPHLEPLTGVFPRLGGLFIASRDLGTETVWLISDNRSGSLAAVEDWLEFDPRWWLQHVFVALRKLAPKYFLNPEYYEWGVYEAPKAEGKARGSIPHEERIEQFDLANLWVIWPTKLTLAPMASLKVKEQIRQEIRIPLPWTAEPEAWTELHMPADVAPERWRKTPLLPWIEFRRCYNPR